MEECGYESESRCSSVGTVCADNEEEAGESECPAPHQRPGVNHLHCNCQNCEFTACSRLDVLNILNATILLLQPVRELFVL